jgi:hypothetical protein
MRKARAGGPSLQISEVLFVGGGGVGGAILMIVVGIIKNQMSKQ